MWLRQIREWGEEGEEGEGRGATKFRYYCMQYLFVKYRIHYNISNAALGSGAESNPLPKLVWRSHTHTTHSTRPASFKIGPCEHWNKGMPAGTTPLHLAAESGDVNKVRLLIKQGEHDVNSRDLVWRSHTHNAQNRARVILRPDQRNFLFLIPSLVSSAKIWAKTHTL